MSHSPPPPPYAIDLESTVDEATVALATQPESVVTWRPSPTAWCAKEIIGHLIDSATNNHQRFVRAARQPDLVFPGYAQDEWVSVQAYARAPWNELLSLWRSYNRHLAWVMAAIPPEIRSRRHARHNLHEIGWSTVAADVPATLNDLMADYVGHLRHHIGQVHDRVRAARAAASLLPASR
jgi:hypothetical protein